MTLSINKSFSLENVRDIIQDKLLPMKWDNSTCFQSTFTYFKNFQAKRVKARHPTQSLALSQGNSWSKLTRTGSKWYYLTPHAVSFHLLKGKWLVFVALRKLRWEDCDLDGCFVLYKRPLSNNSRRHPNLNPQTSLTLGLHLLLTYHPKGGRGGGAV